MLWPSMRKRSRVHLDSTSTLKGFTEGATPRISSHNRLLEILLWEFHYLESI
jgi:hypothetical protein